MLLIQKSTQFLSRENYQNNSRKENLDRSIIKKFEKAYQATPVLEHLYIDNDLRLVKTQREAAQRPSYTIAIRRLATK